MTDSGRVAELLSTTRYDGAERRVAVAGERDASPEYSRDACPWCRGAIPESARRDSRFCSKRCRQASHRFGAGAVARRRATAPLRIAYADPPYPGLARRYYRDHPDFGGEVDHAELLERLRPYDAWALSTSSKALPQVLALCVAGGLEVRVAAWVRGARPHTTSRGPLSSWEPVIYAGGRDVCDLDSATRHLEADTTRPLLDGSTRRASIEETDAIRAAQDDASQEYLRDTSRAAALDTLVHHARPRLTDPGRVIGAKPAAFAYWLFDLLGALPGDHFDDLFPGSGGVARAWARYVETGKSAGLEED